MTEEERALSGEGETSGREVWRVRVELARFAEELEQRQKLAEERHGELSRQLINATSHTDQQRTLLSEVKDDVRSLSRSVHRAEARIDERLSGNLTESLGVLQQQTAKLAAQIELIQQALSELQTKPVSAPPSSWISDTLSPTIDRAVKDAIRSQWVKLALALIGAGSLVSWATKTWVREQFRTELETSQDKLTDEIQASKTLRESLAEASTRAVEEAVQATQSVNRSLAVLSSRSSVVIVSDFAEDDYYIHKMRARLRAAAPEVEGAAFIGLPPHAASPESGRLNNEEFLRACGAKLAFLAAVYPPRTVFLVQCNPAGKSVETIAFENNSGQFFVGYRNLLGDEFASATGVKAAVHLNAGHNGEHLFRGISVLTLGAAQLASGKALNELPESTPYQLNAIESSTSATRGDLVGVVVEVTAFGDCILSVPTSSNASPRAFQFQEGRMLHACINGEWKGFKMVRDFSAADYGDYIAIQTFDRLMLAIQGRQLATNESLGWGHSVQVRAVQD